MSQHQMVQDLELRLTPDDYESLVHKLNVLSEVKDDPKILSFLNTFVSSNNSLVKPPRPETTLDEFGRSLTVASRKTSRAQVYLVKGTGQVYVNGINMAEYFNEIYDREKIVKPFEMTNTLAQYNVWALVKGGGSTGQADSIAVAIARGLTVHEPAHHTILYENGMLKIDRRQVEKKKTGQPKARKKNTWVKRVITFAHLCLMSLVISNRSSGTQTTCMPAFNPASTPGSLSSNTKQQLSNMNESDPPYYFILYLYNATVSSKGMYHLLSLFMSELGNETSEKPEPLATVQWSMTKDPH
ncbi:37S ribosomal protein S9, mitochondrial [Boothiomyces sp. JEL0866]|nr:37S ribosomal protein S9, mitochondrial [Boothiomyces sp. JEL0866]